MRIQKVQTHSGERRRCRHRAGGQPIALQGPTMKVNDAAGTGSAVVHAMM